MKIQKYLIAVRNAKIKVDLISIAFILLMIFIGLSLIFILLESVFYFSPVNKKIILIAIASLIILTICLLAISYIAINQDRYRSYSWSNLASIIGKNIFPNKEDTAINAYQIETQTKKNQSQELADNFIDEVADKISNVNPDDNIDKKSLLNIKFFTVSIMFISIIILSIFWERSSDAFYRWQNYDTQFLAPKPFKLFSLTRNQHILGGEKISITIISEGQPPDSVLLRLTPTQITLNKRDSSTIELQTGRNSSGFYQFELPELFQDYEYEAIVNSKYFYEVWRSVRSKPDTVFVTDRPKLDNFNMAIIPPKYSKLPLEDLDGSVAVIQALKGSIVKINLESNRTLKSCFMKQNDSIKYLETYENKATGEFMIKNEGKFSVHLVDPRGITNRDPVPYHVNILPDNNPTIKVIKPPPIITLGNNQINEF